MSSKYFDYVDRDGQPPRSVNRQRVSERTNQELVGICKGIIADGHVNQLEVEYLHAWVKENSIALGVRPFYEMVMRLDRVMADGVVDEEEAEDLRIFIGKLTGEDKEDLPKGARKTGTAFLTSPAPEITFFRKRFCATGKFMYGTRRQVAKAITERGGFLLTEAASSLNYLVMGDLASRDWLYTLYGRKIETVVGGPYDPKMRAAVVSEAHWAKFLEDAPSKEAAMKTYVKTSLKKGGEDFLREVLISLQISGVGRIWAERIAARFKTIEALRKATEEDYRQELKLGPIATRALVETVASQHKAIDAAVIQLAER